MERTIDHVFSCAGGGGLTLAGALQAAMNGDIDPDATVVCLVTGIGFKDEVLVDAMVADADCPTISIQELRGRISD